MQYNITYYDITERTMYTSKQMANVRRVTVSVDDNCRFYNY